MTFSTIFTVVIIGYIFFYLGMIGYDMFIRKDAIDLVPKQEDEDIDISDEAGSFKPIKVERDERKPKMTQQQPDCDVPPSVESVESNNVSSDSKESANKENTDAGKEETSSKEAQGKTVQTVVTPPEKQSEQNTVGFDDDQPKNRKPLNVQTDDNTSDLNETDDQDLEQSDKFSTTGSADEEKEKEDIIPPKLDLPDNEEDGHTVMELDFEDDSIPYVRIDEAAAMTKMTGGINLEEMLKEARNLSDSGADSEFGKVMAEWKVYEMEKDKDGTEELRLLMSDNSNCGDEPPPVFDIE